MNKNTIPAGLCQCGCGQKTKIAKLTCTRDRTVKGKPNRFIRGHAAWKGGRVVDKNGYIQIWRPDHHHADGRGYVYEHVVVLESSLGRRLVNQERCHHIDGKVANNTPENLVVCQNNKEHGILHQKMRALEVCGNEDFRKCHYCQKYDDIQNMKKTNDKSQYSHRACVSEYGRERYIAMKSKGPL